MRCGMYRYVFKNMQSRTEIRTRSTSPHLDFDKYKKCHQSGREQSSLILSENQTALYPLL